MADCTENVMTEKSDVYSAKVKEDHSTYDVMYSTKDSEPNDMRGDQTATVGNEQIMNHHHNNVNQVTGCNGPALPLAPFLSLSDPDVNFYNEIYHHLLGGRYPPNASETLKRTIRKRSTLYFLSPDGESLLYNKRRSKEVVTNASMQLQLMENAHVESNGVHNGVRKMHVTIFSKHYWRSLYQDVANFVKQCRSCNEDLSSILAKKDAMDDKNELSKEMLWKNVTLQVLGPYNRSLLGNEYLAVISDSASGYLTAQAMPPHNLEAALASFLLHTFCRMGFASCQTVGVSDTMNSNLVSFYRSLRESMVQSLHSLLPEDAGDFQPGTLSTTPQEGDVNMETLKEIEELTEEVVSRDGLSWDIEVQHQVFKHNTRHHKDSNSSPFSLMFGRHPAGYSEKSPSSDESFSPSSGHLVSRRRLRSALLQCRHCDESFTSKISFRIHQRKHTEDAKRRGALEGAEQVPYLVERKNVIPKKGKKILSSKASPMESLPLIQQSVPRQLGHHFHHHEHPSHFMHQTADMIPRSHAPLICVEPASQMVVGDEYSEEAVITIGGDMETAHQGAYVKAPEDSLGDSSSGEGTSGKMTAETVAAVKNLLHATKDERGMRGKYSKYSPELRDEIARYALSHGIKEASEHWSEKMGAPLSESSVRNFINVFKKFSIEDQKEMGKFAALHGVNHATAFFSKKLGTSVKLGQMKKFMKFYSQKVEKTEETLSVEEGHPKRLSSSVGARNSYSNQMREEIGMYALRHSIGSTVKYFSEKLQFPVKVSTVRKFKRQYIEKEKVNNTDTSSANNSSILNQVNLDSTCERTHDKNCDAVQINGSGHTLGNGTFVYQSGSTYPLSMIPTGGNNSLMTNQSTFQQTGGVINQSMSSAIPFHHHHQASPSVIMNQSFTSNQAQQNFHSSNYISSFSSQQGLQGSLSQSVVHPSTAMSSQHITSCNISQQILHSQHHQQQQHHPPLLTCYHSLSNNPNHTPQVYEGTTSMTSEPLCLLKESPQQENPDSIQAHESHNIGHTGAPHKFSHHQVAPCGIPSDSCLTTSTLVEDSPSTLGEKQATSLIQKHEVDETKHLLIDGKQELDIESDEEQTSIKLEIKSPNKRKINRNFKKKSRRGNYVSYSPEERAAIGKFAAIHGNLAAVKHFKTTMALDLPESTVRGLKEKYIAKKMRGGKDVTCLGFAQRGRPMRLGKYDDFVKDCIQQLILSGEKVTSFMVIATAKQVLMQHDPSLLEERGGPIKLNPTWAKSFLRRMGLNHL